MSIRPASILLLSALLTSLVAAPARAEKREFVTIGRIFYEKLDPQYPSFTYEGRRKEEDGKAEVIGTYRDKQGQPLVVERSLFEGDRLLRHSYEQFQVKESGELEVKDGKVRFQFRSPRGNCQDSEDLEPNMITSDMVADHLLKNWKTLMDGDTVKVRFLLIERCESIGFKFFKDKERTLNGRAVVDITMKPSSVFIAALVPKIRLTMLRDEPHSLVESEGRLPVRVAKKPGAEKREDFHAIDARLALDETVELKFTPTPPAPVPSSAAEPAAKVAEPPAAPAAKPAPKLKSPRKH